MSSPQIRFRYTNDTKSKKGNDKCQEKVWKAKEKPAKIPLDRAPSVCEELAGKCDHKENESGRWTASNQC